MQSDRINHSVSIKKSNILNDLFAFVFTVEDTTTIMVNRKGVLKLLNDIKPYKATGPDAIQKD